MFKQLKFTIIESEDNYRGLTFNILKGQKMQKNIYTLINEIYLVNIQNTLLNMFENHNNL